MTECGHLCWRHMAPLFFPFLLLSYCSWGSLRLPLQLLVQLWVSSPVRRAPLFTLMSFRLNSSLYVYEDPPAPLYLKFCCGLNLTESCTSLGINGDSGNAETWMRCPAHDLMCWEPKCSAGPHHPPERSGLGFVQDCVAVRPAEGGRETHRADALLEKAPRRCGRQGVTSRMAPHVVFKSILEGIRVLTQFISDESISYVT